MFIAHKLCSLRINGKYPILQLAPSGSYIYLSPGDFSCVFAVFFMIYFAYCHNLTPVVLAIDTVVYRLRSTMSCCGGLHAIGDCRRWSRTDYLVTVHGGPA